MSNETLNSKSLSPQPSPGGRGGRKRAILLVLDSVGCGRSDDAGEYGDEGADTLGHILEQCPDLQLPNLWSLGLGRVLRRGPAAAVSGSYGVMQPRAIGKDSTTGHWELAGAVLDQPFGLFTTFPPELVAAIEHEADVRFIGNLPASGTAILDEIGPAHLSTGKLILYTSADSVLQIAAHEQLVPLDRLYDVCKIARRHADGYRIGRVIARPFVGEAAQGFTRTANRHDFSMQPPPTVLNALRDADVPVVSIGKTSDLFDGSGFSASYPTASDAQGMGCTDQLWAAMDRGLLFVNLVDFDTLFGHRRDAGGYAANLARFDAWLGTFLPAVGPDDLLIITADHGNDPTFPGTDHTRERVPVLMKFGPMVENLGVRDGFADVAATLRNFFGLPAGADGVSLI